MRTRGTWLMFVVVALLASLDARADLALRVAPTPVDIAQGGNADVMLHPQRLEGFPEHAQSVEFSLKDFAIGTAAGTPTAMMPALDPVSLKIVVNSDAPAGAHPVTIVAVVKDAGGNVIGDKEFADALTVNVTASGCAFEVVPTPPSFRILQGGTARLDVLASLSGGCSGPFTFSATAPPGVTVDGPHSAEAPNTRATFQFSAESSASAGDYTAEIRVEGGGETRTVTVPFGIKSMTMPTLKIELPPVVELRAGEVTTFPLVIRAEHFTGPIEIQTRTPAGVTLEPAAFTVQAGESTSVTVRVAPDAQPLPPGADVLYASAQATAGGQLLHKQFQTTVRIIPAASAAPGFEIAIQPREVEVRPNETGTFTVVASQTGGAPGALRAISASNHASDTVPNDPSLGATIVDPVSFALTPGTPQNVSVRIPAYVPAGRYRVRWRFEGMLADGSRLEGPVEDEMVVVVPGAPVQPTTLQITADPQEASLDPTGTPTIFTVNVTAPPGEQVDTDSLDVLNVSLGTLERTQSGSTVTYRFPISGVITAPQTLTFRFVTRPNYLRGSVSVVAHPGTRTVTPEVSPHDVSLWPGESATFDIGVREAKGVYKLRIDASPVESDVRASVTGGEMLPPFDARAQLRVEVEPGVQGGTRTVNLQFSDPNAGPTPAPVRTVPVAIKVRKIDADVRLEGGSVELRPGESKTVRVSVTGKDGWSGPVSVDVKAPAGLVVRPEILQIESLPGSAELSLHVPEGTAAGALSVRLQARPHGRDWTMDSTSFNARVLGPPAAFTVAAIPSKLAIQGGSFEKFTVVVERQDGWNGAVDVSLGGTDRVVVEPKRFRLEPGTRTAEVKVSVAEGTAASAGFEPSLTISARPEGGGEPVREAFVALSIRDVPRAVAFSLGSTETDAWIFASDPARFKVFASGEQQWNGRVKVTARYEHAQPELAGRPDSEIVIRPQSFTLDTGDPAAQSQEIVVETGPQFSFKRDDMSNSGQYGSFTTKGYRIIFEATPEGGGETKSLTVKLGTRPFPARGKVIELRGPAEPVLISRLGTTQFTVEVGSRIQTPVGANVSARHSSLTITPAQTWVHTRERSSVTFTVAADAAYVPGTEPILLEAIPEGGEKEQAETLIVAVRAPRGSGKGQPMTPEEEDRLQGPGPQPGEQLPPVEFPGVVEGNAFSAVSQIEQTRGYLEGMSSAVAATQSLYSDGEQYELALGFTQAFDALLNELRSSRPLQVGANEPAIDSVLAARLLARYAEHPRVAADHQTASLFPQLLFQRYLDPETADLMADVKQGRVNWKDMARRLEPVEILIQQMRAANQSKHIDLGIAIANETLADLNARISEKRLDQIPLPQAQVAVKSLALTAAAVATLDLVSKASIAVVPSRVAELYSTVGDVRAHSILVAAGENPRINLNQPAELAVWMTGQARGGNVVRPTQIVKQIAIPLWAAWGLRGKGKKPDSNDGPSSQDSNRDGQPDWASQEAFEAFLWSELYNRLAMIPVLGQWAGQLGKTVDAQFTIKPYKTGPFRINSDRILTFKIDNRSDQILSLSQQGNQPFLTGIRVTAPREEAGYWYGLKGWLIKELGEATDGLGLNRKGVVEVVVPGPAVDCEAARREYQKTHCAPPPGRYQGPLNGEAECQWNGTKCDCRCVTRLF